MKLTSYIYVKITVMDTGILYQYPKTTDIVCNHIQLKYNLFDLKVTVT